MSGYPARCAKCGELFASDDALEDHLVTANHPADEDYPVFVAKTRYEHAIAAAGRAELALLSARADYERMLGHAAPDPRRKRAVEALHSGHRRVPSELALPMIECSCGWWGSMGLPQKDHIYDVMIATLSENHNEQEQR